MQRGAQPPAEAAPVEAHARVLGARHDARPVDGADEGELRAGLTARVERGEQGQQQPQAGRRVVVELGDEWRGGPVLGRVLEEPVLLEGGHAPPLLAVARVARVVAQQHARLRRVEQQHVLVLRRLRLQRRQLRLRRERGEEEAHGHLPPHPLVAHPAVADRGAALRARRGG